MASLKGQARSEPATPIIREDPSSLEQQTPTQTTFSALSHTKVRDFAYPPSHPLHYGPPPIPSVGSTPGSARNSGLFAGSNGIGSFLGWWNPGGASPGGRRMSDSAAALNRDPRGHSNHPPPLKFADGPPWFEDEDLVSPVIITNKHRKHKSSLGLPQGRRSSKDGKMTSISENLGAAEFSNGTVPSMEELGEPGGTYHPATGYYEDGEEDEEEYEEDSDEEYEGDESRYSKDYHFSIADPDEEMHGKAVALFDFTRENDNELELVEGQVIWVSYRHGQGWLVAEDPRTGESGLVPEEYVRLFKETPFQTSPDAVTPQDTEPPASKLTGSPTTHMAAVQSHFSTSSKDLERFPHTEQLLDPSFRLGSPPPNVQRDASRPPMDRKDSQKSESAMEVDALSPTTIDREQFAIQQRKLETGKVLNGKDKSEQEEYQTLHHKSPSMSGKASPASTPVSGSVPRDKDGDAAMMSASSKEPEEARGRPVEAR